ncbi:MAG: type II toxin-antitoxin system RelE/ParE family toxin [Nitrospirota bacterium]
MPPKHRLHYLPAAVDDLISIHDWIASNSSVRARAFIESVDKRIGGLAIHPQLGRIPRHPKLKAFGYRVLVMDSYLVFYVIRGRTVEIHRIVHGSRHLDEIV